MRGTLSGACATHGNGGIIPADAGNTQAGSKAGLRTRDHPRGCGEHFECVLACDLHAGSSPRMRGTRGNIHQVVGCLRIIPADAGNTWRG